MSLPFNLDLFKQHRFSSSELKARFACVILICSMAVLPDPRGDLLCPSVQCDIKFTLGLDEHDADPVDLETIRRIWLHVYQDHPDLFQDLENKYQMSLQSTYSTTNNKVILYSFQFKLYLWSWIYQGTAFLISTLQEKKSIGRFSVC